MDTLYLPEYGIQVHACVALMPNLVLSKEAFAFQTDPWLAAVLPEAFSFWRDPDIIYLWEARVYMTGSKCPMWMKGPLWYALSHSSHWISFASSLVPCVRCSQSDKQPLKKQPFQAFAFLLLWLVFARHKTPFFPFTHLEHILPCRLSFSWRPHLQV